MPPKLHDGLISGGRLGGHGDHLDAIVVTGVGHWVTSHRCLKDGGGGAGLVWMSLPNQ